MNSFEPSISPFSQPEIIRSVVNMALPKPPVEVPKYETDNEYATREFESGLYYAPLMEVANRPCLRDLFLDNLKRCNKKLHDVLI